MHDESKIAAYGYAGRLPTAILDEATNLGLAGALILNNVDDMVKVNSLSGTVFILSHLVKERVAANNVNVCFELDAYENADDKAAFEKDMSELQRTSIGLFAPKYFTGEVDPVLTASATANLMDNTGGGEFILLTPRVSEKDDSCGDAMVQLCEELSYLDVEGPTIKSRLIVSAMDDDQVVPPNAVWRLADLYGPKARRHQLSPKDFGLAEVGHIGAFARRNAAIWPRLIA